MVSHSSYLVCKEHLNAVKEFLLQFFPEEQNKYSHDDWITFRISSEFTLNLMKGSDQEMTQNMTFEIGCETKKELNSYAKRFNKSVESFTATETGNPYQYHYIELYGPKSICKIEINYCETNDNS